jgi:DNA polymerase-3 subunit delta'
MSLKEIFCQDKAISTLQRAFATGRMPHAYIFAGTEGIGKFKTAYEWGRLLLCEKPVIKEDFADSCERCESCKLFEADSHPDFNPVYKELIQFTREGKGKTTPVYLPIDVIREFLIEKMPTRPTLSERKVFVVSEAEKLNNASQNALMKVLEEPPAYCCIILLCTRMEKLLPTTKSRCRIIRFSSIDEDRIVEKLEQMGTEKKQAQYFARLAQGSLGQGCQLAELELAEANLYEIKKELINSLADCEYHNSLELAEWLLEQSRSIAAIWGKLEATTSKTDINRRIQKTLVRIIISALYDVMKLHISPEKTLINFDQKKQLKKLAERFDAETGGEKIADCYKTLRWIEAAVNEKLIFEQLLLNLVVFDKIEVR